jgi:hypothetical protein
MTAPLSSDDQTDLSDLSARHQTYVDQLKRAYIFMMSQGAIAGPSGPPHSLEEVRIRAYPQDAENAPAADEVVLQKRWTRLVMSAWP